MSINPPNLTVALGPIGIPQGDIIEATVHLGATKEVSSWELLLQNWNGKYSPTGTYPLNVGLDGYICIGRGANVPQLITTRTEAIKFESTPTENYVRISGRCWGEKLFRYTLTKDYSGYKGEAIIKNLIDYYAGLNHTRNSTELIEDTDTTFTDLQVKDTQTWDILRKIASSSDKTGTIGYDFRIAPDGKFEFFPRGTKTNPINLTDKIEHSEYSKEITAIRNKITIYGVAEKSTPLNKTDWTQTLTPTDGIWQAISGEISLEQSIGSPYCIKLNISNLTYGACLFTFNTGHLVNANLYPELHFAIQKETPFQDRIQIILFDNTTKTATCQLTAQSPGDGGIPNQWTLQTLKTGTPNADNWTLEPDFDWTQIHRIGLYCYCPTTASGNFWIDKLFFTGLRYSATQQDNESQTTYGTREYTDTDEELYSDTQCTLRAKAILNHMKNPTENLTIKSTIIDYTTTPLLAADTIHITLPNEAINTNFQIINAEYKVNTQTQTLEIKLELGHEKPLLADYIYTLHAKTSALNRYKTAKT